MNEKPSAADEGSDLDVRVVRGAPTDEELAAVLAVLHSLPSAPALRPAADDERESDWRRSQRPLRATPLRSTWH